MLWYKFWIDTRWRFLIGLGLMLCSAASTVLVWPKVMGLMPAVSALDVKGELGRQIRESAALAQHYQGYVWSQWFRQNVMQLGTLFAALLGTGGLIAQAPGGAPLFTLSLPVSRNRLFQVRAATGLGELLLLSFLPSLFIPLLSPVIGESYSLGDSLVHSACLFIVTAVFFSLALLLSTVFSDIWRPLLIVVSVAVFLALCEQFLSGSPDYGVFKVMSAEVWFRSGRLPWPGLLVSAAASVGLLYAGARNIANRDF